jgi:hypothetical protein
MPINSKIVVVVTIDSISETSALSPIIIVTNAILTLIPIKMANPPIVGTNLLCELRLLGFLVSFLA